MARASLVFALVCAVCALVSHAQTNVVVARTYYSDVFRLKGTGAQATFEVFVSYLSPGVPSAVGVSFPDPDTLDLASAGPFPVQDYFAASNGTFAQVVGVQYAGNGVAGGGVQTASNSQVVTSSTQFASLAQQSPWYGVPQFSFLFSPAQLQALMAITCDGYPPCTGDLTPFLSFPGPMFLPNVAYANFLTLAPAQGITWAENKVENSNTFSQQPALTYATYNGHVIGWQPKIALSVFRTLKNASSSCPSFQAGWPQPREYESDGWYPNTYSVSYDPATTRFSVSLSQLQLKQSYANKLSALQKLQTNYNDLQVLLQQVLTNPPDDKVVINNNMSSIITSQ